MARNAKDAAAILSAIAGADPNDPTALHAPVPDYLAGIGESIRGLRIGIDWSYAGDVTDESVKKALEEAIRTLEKLGAIIVPIQFPAIDDIFMAGLTFFSVECALAHEATYPSRKDEYGPSLAFQIELGRAAGGMDMARAQNARLAFSEQVKALFGGVDLLIAPAIAMEVPTPEEANAMFADGENGLPRMVRFTLPFDATGGPTITLPCGADARGLPIGFQLAGPHLSEGLLVRAANAYQSVTDWHTRHPDV
jgi:amidase